MPEKIRFHMDENVDSAIAEGLRRQGLDVTTTPELSFSGATDEEQVAFIMREHRVIFTHDADFLRLHQQGVEHPGIVYVKQGKRTIGEMVRSLVKIHNTLCPDSMRNHVEFI
jgi:predicted nuclease of predicted toxin-antitoxin system